MPTVRESVCCREITEIESKLEELDGDPSITCITDHPGFNGVCLDQWVLQTAFYHIRHSYGSAIVTQVGPSHKYAGDGNCCSKFL